MKEKILIKIENGLPTVYAATLDINVIVLDYDGLDVGEDLSASWEYPENIWDSKQIEDYVEQEIENTKINENDY